MKPKEVYSPERTAKIFARLNSPYEGERAAAARKLKAALDKLGIDLNDNADIGAIPKPNPQNWAEMFRLCRRWRAFLPAEHGRFIDLIGQTATDELTLTQRQRLHAAHREALKIDAREKAEVV